ncbi:MAG TPA: DMT family transporter [Anaerolineales bacterium]|nr:DMT family transporter [Anaerolineales bacterium]HQX17311.1 DMT family transporter [Anaerolineales bacterium]
MLSILYGIASSLSWGAGDFAGGLASRKVGAYRAVLYADFFGLLILAIVSIFYRESFPNSNVVINSLIGGALGTCGLLILYHSLSIGQMSIAAPVSALFAALLPVIFGAVTQGLPSAIQFIGFALALAAVWLISQGDGGFHIGKLSDLKFPILAGVGFGCYFIFIHNAVSDPDSLLWPMILSRLAGTLLVFLIVLARREPLPVPHGAWTVALINATLDLGGNFFFILASKAGRLDIASILSSLYPGMTVTLAWLILKERISRKQVIGIALAFAAIYLFTI